MAKTNAHMLAFNRGEVSKLALARIDLAKLQLATECQVNWMPFKVGPAMLRPGLEFIGEILGDKPCALIDFAYSATDTALLELTDSVMRVWINDVLLTRGAVGTTVADPNFAGGGSWVTTDTTAGCTATVSGGVATLTAGALGGLARIKQTLTVAGGDQNKEHGLQVLVSNGPVTIRIGSADGLSDYLAQTVIDSGNHQLVFTPTGAAAYLQIDSNDLWAKTLTNVSISAGTLAIPTPWTAADLPNLRWAQSKDIIYVACYGKQQYKIERRGVRPGAHGWSVVQYRSSDGPFHATADDPSVTMTPAALSGNTTITASRPFFNGGHVGALLRLFTPGQVNSFAVGAANVFTPATRVAGVQLNRELLIEVSGTWSGAWELQRSVTDATSGFSAIASSDGGWNPSNPNFTANLTPLTQVYYDDNSTSSGVVYDNVIAWYRMGFSSLASGFGVLEAGTQQGGGYGIARILSVNSPTQVSVEVLSPFTQATVAATLWQISDWCSAFGWPTSVRFQEGRLWWLSGGTIPIAGSVSNNYTSYAQEDADGTTLGDAGAILEDFGEGPSDRINWVLGLSRLIAGREGSISSMRSSSFDAPMTPTDFIAKNCSVQGAARLPAIAVGKRGIFVDRSGGRVYELFFNPQAADYDDSDLTTFNQDIAMPGFVDATAAVQPDTTLYFPRSDGQVACLLYDPNDDVVAWWRLMTLGAVENARSLPRPSGGDDLVYFCVRRVIGGVTKRFLERLTLRADNAGGVVNSLFDSHVGASGSGLTSVTLAHLPGTAVGVWADGAFIGTGTTDASGLLSPLPDNQPHNTIRAGLLGGSVSYSGAATSTMTGLAAYNSLPGEFFADQQPSNRMVHIGTLTPAAGAVTLPNGITAASIVGYFGFMAPLMSAKLAYAGRGTPLTQKKKLDSIGLIAYDMGSTALQFGQRFDALDPLPVTEDDDDVGENAVWSEYDEPGIDLPGEWDTDARLCLLGQAPFPAKLGALVVGVTTNEK